LQLFPPALSKHGANRELIQITNIRSNYVWGVASCGATNTSDQRRAGALASLLEYG